MQLCLLHLDDALTSQPDFIRACDAIGARHIEAKNEGSHVRLWGRQAALDELAKKMREALKTPVQKPTLSFMGSGDFHHITALLIPAMLENLSGSVTIIHFDNHPDWVKFEGGMHCGSWVGRALEHPQVAKVVTIGVCSKDLHLPEYKGARLSLLTQNKLELYPYDHAPSRVGKNYGQNPCFEQNNKHLNWKTIRTMGEENFLDFILTRIPTEQVYFTVDKDVLSREDAITNWDQGHMHLSYLLQLIRAIGKHHRIVGADVTGDYSTPHYAGNLWTRLSKRAEIFIDQPHETPSSASSAEINSAGNHALLHALSEVMA